MWTAAGMGAGLMYMLDPQGGGRRRARVRDRLAKGRRKGADALSATGRDVAHRTSGLMGRLGRLFHRGPVDDRVLESRVRSKMGRAVSHPGALAVEVEKGRVMVRGPILETEVDDLLAAVDRVPGVREVHSELDVYWSAADVPALQGRPARASRRAAFNPAVWSPTTRLLVGSVGAVVAWRLASRAMAHR